MKNSDSGESIFKKKGFFIALYSCLGAVIVLALVVSFTNLMTGPDNNTARGPDAENESLSVSADNVESYLIKAQEQEQAELDEQVWRKPTPKPTETARPSASPPVTPPPQIPIPIPAAQPPAPDPAPEPAATPDAPTAPTAAEPAAPEKAMTFAPFSEGDNLLWPVQGEIAMAFSMDKLVYDPTLDQYRTNDDLRISAQEGTPVKACADGTVLEIGNNRVYGNYVKINHGNEWLTAYGQLMDGILVKEGDVVSKGQVIGGVGKPSAYGSLNGTHVNLRVTQADEAIDPLTLFAAGE